jgi:hypothetical protein
MHTLIGEKKYKKNKFLHFFSFIYRSEKIYQSAGLMAPP